jgi:hypothetical protein
MKVSVRSIKAFIACSLSVDMMLHLDQEYLLHRWSQRLDKEVGRWTARYVLTSAERPDGFYHESNTHLLRAELTRCTITGEATKDRKNLDQFRDT